MCFIISVACLLGFLYLKQNNPVTIRSSLTEVKEIILNFKGYQSQGYSPVCGCYEIENPEDWRGITFATRHLKIERKGLYPITAYMVIASMPDKITWKSEGFRFKANLYFISIPKYELFKPELVLSNKLPSSYRIIDKKDFEPKRYFMIFSDKEMNVNLLGDKPLVGWIPSNNSKVKIEYLKDMFPSSKVKAKISENYEVKTTKSPLQKVVGMPMADFLGQNTVLWSDDAALKIMVGKEMIEVPSVDEQNRIITVLVTNPPFSTRVALIPEESDAALTYKEILVEEKNLEPDYLPILSYPPDESGTVEVSISDVETTAEEFSKVYSKMKENDIITIPKVYGDFIARDIETGEVLHGKAKKFYEMDFRYPPIPPNPGFNIFGSFSSISFNQAKGQFSIGSQQIDIDLPSNLELQDIKSLKVDDNVMQVPIKWMTSENKAEIKLQATAQAYLNGNPLGKGFDVYKQYIEYALIFCSIASFIAAILQVILAQRSLKQTHSPVVLKRE